MAGATVSFVLNQLYNLASEEGTLLRGVHKDFHDIKVELEGIVAFLKDADTRASVEDGGERRFNEGVKTWVKQVREASFRIEDVVDYYIMYLAKHSGSGGMAFQMIKTLKKRHVIASELKDIKSSIGGIKERSLKYEFKAESGPGSSQGNTQSASLSFKKTVVVGFESSRDELVTCLVEGTNELMLVSVVGMAGLGKTTLVKDVFDNELVTRDFDCRSFIRVSQPYTVRGLLIDMVKQLCKGSNESIPNDLQDMEDNTLITHVRQYLESKRYLVIFDDVWKENFYDEIQHTLISNNKRSRIIVTTRMMHVAEYFKKAFPVHVHELQPLSPEKAWELFCNTAFGYEPKKCPAELEGISGEIVKKCGGLPLALVAIGGLLSTKSKTIFEWEKVRKNLTMELGRNAHLSRLLKFLSLSYDDLPSHLKSCMLYFGLYPEGYIIKRKRLTRQWMAEGFVKEEENRPLEEVAEEHMTQLIHRSLVQVSKVGFDGKVKSCQVHDMLREVIIKKMKDLSFCHLIQEDDEQITVEIIRRFSIAANANNVLSSSSNTGIRAIFVFDKEELNKNCMGRSFSKFKLLKVLDFQNSLLKSIPDDLGNLFHLRYLNLSHTKVMVLPKSIGKLINLETLDLRQTQVQELPKDINKLTKLRLLPVYYRNYEDHYSMLNFTRGVQMQKGIGSLISLQRLYFLEADHGGLHLIQELKKLRHLRKLGIRRVRGEYGNALCAAIKEMKHLESLNITAIDGEEILDLDLASAPPYLRVLNLKCKLTKLPKWIPNLKYLVKLRLGLSNFEDDPLDSLKNLPNLLRLNLWDDAFSGERLHFQKGGFHKLKELDLTRLSKLSSVSIDEEALDCLEHFRFNDNRQLTKVPQDIQNLKNLRFLGFSDMPTALVDSIDLDKDGLCHWIINHIPLVQIRKKVGTRFHDYELRPICTQLNI